MNVSRIIDRAVKITQDASFTRPEILEYVNEGYSRVADLAYIPSLVKIETITVRQGVFRASLPDNFVEGRLYDATLLDVTSGKGKIKIHHKYSTFLRRYHGVSEFSFGEITDVCPSGGYLHIWPEQSSDQRIELVYQAYPDVLSDSTGSVPEALPPHLHAELLSNYATYKMFDMIEDGVNDKKDNTKHRLALFMSAVEEVRHIHGPGIDLPDFVPEEDF